MPALRSSPGLLVSLSALTVAAGCAKTPAAAGDDATGPGPAPQAGTVSLPAAGAHAIQPFAFGQDYSGRTTGTGRKNAGCRLPNR
jgi:hypothetical protein